MFAPLYGMLRPHNVADAAVSLADGLAGCIRQDGYLAGRLQRDWSKQFAEKHALGTSAAKAWTEEKGLSQR